jgi:hypothetical protein
MLGAFSGFAIALLIGLWLLRASRGATKGIPSGDVIYI